MRKIILRSSYNECPALISDDDATTKDLEKMYLIAGRKGPTRAIFGSKSAPDDSEQGRNTRISPAMNSQTYVSMPQPMILFFSGTLGLFLP